MGHYTALQDGLLEPAGQTAATTMPVITVRPAALILVLLARDFSSAQFCGAGKFKRGANCVNCPAGRFGDGRDAVQCFNCPGGKYGTNAGSAACSMCPTGRYSVGGSGAARTAGHCIACPKGYASYLAGASCTVCGIGSFSKGGASVCSMCPMGYAQVRDLHARCAI